jgi:hypothetical protein
MFLKLICYLIIDSGYLKSIAQVTSEIFTLFVVIAVKLILSYDELKST